MGVRIHDSELAELLITEPFLRSSESALPTLAKHELWSASTASQWAERLKDHRNTASSTGEGRTSIHGNSITGSLTAYIKLEGLTSNIIENRISGSLGMHTGNIMDSLMQIHSQQIRGDNTNSSDVLSLQALWHCSFITLFADLNRIELAVGREGFEKSQQHTSYVVEWARSADGARCALHAALVLRNVEDLAIGAEPAIHVPRVVYRSALVWYAYTRYGQGDSPPQVNMDFPELS